MTDYTNKIDHDAPATTKVSSEEMPLAASGRPPISLAWEGSYDVKAGYQGREQSTYNLQVKAGVVTKQEINLGSGLLSLTVDEQDGVPGAQASGL
ncbi:MAG: hypothetical protein IVW55_17195 [Chloroflexi bacterium]|nr:hypothetical protein [Chloroflexota bacterium]